jgi:serpin B
MRSAFDRDRADFTGIANPPNKADRLFISQVFHKGFVRVDEKGTEAAAATAVSMARAGGMPAEPRPFKADHPFSFVIRDNASGLILFLGRVLDPTTE